MNPEELKKQINDSLTEALKPLHDELQQLKSAGQKPPKEEPKPDELSPAVKTWLEDKKTGRFNGRSLDGTEAEKGQTEGKEI